MTLTKGPLSGVRVLDLGTLMHAPQAAATLCDWGAEVIKVELPKIGDQARHLAIAPDDRRSGCFVACNRGKRSITVDLRTTPGRELLLRLVETSDVMLSNFVPGTLESWGLGYDVVAARNPRLVYAVGSTFGERGPDAERGGADLSAQAEGGLLSTIGAEGTDPTPVGATIADHIGAQNLVGGVLAALFARERTGRGQLVTSSLLGGQIWAQAWDYTEYLMAGRVVAGRTARGSQHVPGIYGVFPTADGWIAVVGVRSDERASFYAAIGRADLADRFPSSFYWGEEKARVHGALDEVFSTRSTAEWCEVLADAGIRYARVRDHADVATDDGAWKNGYFATLDGPTGPVSVVLPPVGFSDTPAVPGSNAPELGQDTELVLLELGYSWDEITALRESAVI